MAPDTSAGLTKMVKECEVVEIWESEQTKETEHGHWPLHIRVENIPALSIIITFEGGSVPPLPGRVVWACGL